MQAGISAPNLRVADFGGEPLQCARRLYTLQLHWYSDTAVAGLAYLCPVPFGSWLCFYGRDNDRFNAPCQTLSGLRGMAATVDIEAGEPLVSLPVGAALVVTPKQRCPFPAFCSPAFYSSKPWQGLALSTTPLTEMLVSSRAGCMHVPYM